MDLKYTTGDIRALEKELDMSLLEVFNDYSITRLSILVKYGLDLDSLEESDKKIDQYLLEDEKNDGFTLFFNIAEVINDTGFLSRKINIKEAEKKANKQLKSAQLKGK